jgi:hypothetical protein
MACVLHEKPTLVAHWLCWKCKEDDDDDDDDDANTTRLFLVQ